MAVVAPEGTVGGLTGIEVPGSVEASREPLFLKDRSPLHYGDMSDSVVEAKPANPGADEWAARIAAQQFSEERVLLLYA